MRGGIVEEDHDWLVGALLIGSQFAEHPIHEVLEDHGIRASLDNLEADDGMLRNRRSDREGVLADLFPRMACVQLLHHVAHVVCGLRKLGILLGGPLIESPR